MQPLKRAVQDPRAPAYAPSCEIGPLLLSNFNIEAIVGGSIRVGFDDLE